MLVSPAELVAVAKATITECTVKEVERCLDSETLLLDIREIRHASRAVIGVVTVGLLIALLLAGCLAHFLFGWSWELSYSLLGRTRQHERRDAIGPPDVSMLRRT